MTAVQQHGGRAAGEQLSKREHCRRLLNSLGWQSAQLLACLSDLSMLLADIGGAPLAMVNTVTGFVLLLFSVDLGLRIYAFRRMLLRCACLGLDRPLGVATRPRLLAPPG